MKLIVAVVLFFVPFISGKYFYYDGYKLYQIRAADEAELNLLKLFDDHKYFDFWSHTRIVGEPIDVLVHPKGIKTLTEVLEKYQIAYKVLIENMKWTVGYEKFLQDSLPEPRNGGISFDKYHRYDKIVSYLQELNEQYPDITSLQQIGITSEGRSLYVFKITAGNNKKPAILIDAGIHAREWIAPPIALYIINQLVENPENRALIENAEWHVIPVLNPDGYEYTHTDERFWRKTRSKGQRCDGVDGNRNFDFHWMEVGADDYECSDIYAGPKPFSEPETNALREYALAHADDIKLYLTFHSYGKFLLYPWGWTSGYPENREELHQVASKANEAIASFRGIRYTVGSSTNVLYAAAGGSDDWMMGVAGVKLSYTVELPGGGGGGFDLPPSQISTVVQETWLGVKEFYNYVVSKYN